MGERYDMIRTGETVKFPPDKTPIPVQGDGPLTKESGSAPPPIHEQRGFELISHFIAYGASQSELEELDAEQVATLEMAGELR